METKELIDKILNLSGDEFETKEDYIDGFTYYDYRRKKWYTYNNGRFIPVE